MNTSSTESRTVRGVCAAVAFLLAGCGGGDGPVTPKPTEAKCDGVAVNVRALAPFERVVISGSDVTCFALEGGDREYLVVPQLTGATLPYGGYGFRLGDPTAVTARIEPSHGEEPAWLQVAQGQASAEPIPDAQSALDARMREREATWQREASPRTGGVQLRSQSVQSAIDTTRTFSVLNTLGATAAYTPVAARLRFSGARVLLYVDTLAAAAFTDAELAGMGTLYDQRLAPAVSSTFGSGSDIDGNARVIFLLTPTVNAIVTASQCTATGFVRGFFFNQDLTRTDSTSNRGEVFYAYVPDESGRWSCAHTKSEVLANLPPTFMHELQHMVSFGEHAIKRNGKGEEVWLNEGLSHMAEEIGSLTYESRFPAPSGRTNPTSIFPDSASPFINPNVLYSYRYLFSSAIYSVTSCAPAHSVRLPSAAERGSFSAGLRISRAARRSVGWWKPI